MISSQSTPKLYTVLSLLQDSNTEFKKQVERQFPEYLNQNLILAVPKSCLNYSNGTYYLSTEPLKVHLYDLGRIEPQTKRRILSNLNGIWLTHEFQVVLIPITETISHHLTELNKTYDLLSQERFEHCMKIRKYDKSPTFFNDITKEQRDQLESRNEQITNWCLSKITIELSIPLFKSDLIEISYTGNKVPHLKENDIILETLKISKLTFYGKIKSPLDYPNTDLTFRYR